MVSLGRDLGQWHHEKNVHGIQDHSANSGWSSDTLKLDNILLVNRVDGTLSSSQVRQGSLQLLLSLLSLDVNEVGLLDTSILDNSDLVSLCLGFLVLNLEFFKKLVGDLSSLLQFDFFFLQVNLKSIDSLGSVSQLLKSLDDVLLVDINEVVLVSVDILVEVDEGQVTLWSNVDVSSHSLEVKSAHFVHDVVDLTHVCLEFSLDGRLAVNLEVVEELARHRDKSFLGPWEEPIDDALGEQ